ncbi:hypothetical protein POX_h09828 [Penicillium oxalicum]|uniref:Uncharacterized protein n=1 Tax=Penicillium oxalicum (strain 114-2 / CGMCC 5302) TaxID=933388 RepID=S7ZLM4_PENO1|nr:hypothetical protein POX_h09828 [Penicillium oxalicum]EPS31550.1 hypothetical protein PDE_06505 [Penicillium oxalicum 114-2]KAI2786062.1 hypothetical protein POX_h09828 [Penicillium oxalicum]
MNGALTSAAAVLRDADLRPGRKNPQWSGRVQMDPGDTLPTTLESKSMTLEPFISEDWTLGPGLSFVFDVGGI